jgi:hypothetical protein
MSSVYTDYFQKSKVFLYPLLELKRGITYVPVQTYVCWEDVYSIDDCKLMCEYHVKSSDKFNDFCDRYLNNHEFFHKYVDLGNNKHLFVFNLISIKYDFSMIILGKYSKISISSKLTILDFFNSSGDMLSYIVSFLSPKHAHKEYAEEFKMDIEDIKEIYEVCSILNIEKETFKNNNLLIDCLLNKNSISLDK